MWGWFASQSVWVVAFAEGANPVYAILGCCIIGSVVIIVIIISVVIIVCVW